MFKTDFKVLKQFFKNENKQPSTLFRQDSSFFKFSNLKNEW